jgi:hypothetical protein
MKIRHKFVLQEPDVVKAAMVLDEKIREAAARNGHSVKSVVVVVNGDFINNTISEGCICEDCLNRMIDSLVQFRDGTREEPHDDSGCGVN